MKLRAALLLLAIAAPAPAPAFTLLDGPMPWLSGRKTPVTPDPRAFSDAPRPDFDTRAPVSRDRPGVILAPGLTNRSSVPNPTANSLVPGSAFSDSLNRNRRGSNELGGTWAPSLQLRVPLQ